MIICVLIHCDAQSCQISDLKWWSSLPTQSRMKALSDASAVDSTDNPSRQSNGITIKPL